MAEDTSGSGKPVRVGLFDIRIIIGGLIGIYGIILVIAGLFTGGNQIDKSDGLNINLVGGICMVIGAAVFIIWARLRPIVVPQEAVEDEGTDGSAH